MSYGAGDVKVVVSCPKAHEERGRVERRIRLIREMLEQTGADTSSPQSPLMWKTMFARVANCLNNLPIAKGNGHSGTVTVSFDIIMPNRILMGRSLGEGIDFEASANLQRLLARSHDIFAAWYRLYIKNIHLLNAPEGKWTKSSPPLSPGDVVLFVVLESASGSKKDGMWRLGRVLWTER